mgnify:CR=1 FL=1
MLCAAFVDLGEGARAGCVFDREGSAESEALLDLDRLDPWLTDATITPALLSEPQTFSCAMIFTKSSMLRRCDLAGELKER